MTMDSTNLASGTIADLSLAISGVTSAFSFSDVQVTVDDAATPNSIVLDVVNNIASGDVTFFEGGSRDDVFTAGDGDDFLTGGGGDDLLDGGLGSDTFIFAPGSGNDQIVNFEGGAGAGDVLDLVAYALSVDGNGIPLGALQQGDDVLIDLGGGDSILLLQTDIATLNGDDFLT
jgi:Ca2+-binding RTX toxin-like protein